MYERRPSTQTRFARSTREAYGSLFPIEQRRNLGDRFVLAVCIVGLIVLVLLEVL